jgi:pimeloyl-ACP methyl ester carboxylesterase
MSDLFASHFFHTSDGPKIEFREYHATAPASGTPVLCLHGLTRNNRDFEELAPMIAACGRRVLVPSQRGRGASDADPSPDRYHPSTYAGDMLALLSSLNIPRAIFIGTSMGGLMTMICAALAPARVAAAVLNDVGPEVDPKGLARIRGYVGRAEAPGDWDQAAAICRAINGSAFPTETSSDFWLKIARRVFWEPEPGNLALQYDPAISQVVNSPAAVPPDLWLLFDALKPIPTLVVRGELSDILMLSTVEEMQRRKPDLVVANVPDVGHAPFLTEPAAWNAIASFLSDQPSLA